MEKLENIFFDTDDRDLFLIDDTHLKANAIRYSILPKLNVILQYVINQINKVYTINIFDDCSIAQAPSFRLNNRKNEIKKNYDYANIRIKGKRKYGKWKGIKKENGVEPKIAPYSIGVELNHEGLFIFLDNQEQYVSKQSHQKVFDFLINYESVINVIQQSARVFTEGKYSNDWFIISTKEWIKSKMENADFHLLMLSDVIPYSITKVQFNSIIDRLTLLYPIFHTYIQIAKGEKIIFKNLVAKAKILSIIKNQLLI